MQAYRTDFPGPEFNGQFDKLTDRTEGTPGPEFNGQFDKLTDRTDFPVPELAEGGALLCPQ